MATTIRVISFVIEDVTGSGPVKGTAAVIVKSDDPVAVAVSGGQIGAPDTRPITLSRGAWNALIAAAQRDKGDAWPDGSIAHPIAKAP